MDSGNSGSLQSSSGGDEEYESRGESISSFLNPSGHPSGHFGTISAQQPPFLHHHQPPTFFDHPHLQNLDSFQQGNPNANTQYNNDLVWTRGLRSAESNYGNFGNLTGTSSSRNQVLNTTTTTTSQDSLPNPSSAVQLQAQSDNQPIKNLKKRPRASRRAPTTVLTTDTTNFRQMVQEFTGIPTAPFSGSPYSRRLDLLSTARSGHFDTLGSPYPLRPSVPKLQLSQFVPSSSSPLFNSTMIDAIVPTTIPTSYVANLNSNNFQFPTDIGIPKQPQNLLNLQNQISLLHSSSLKQHQLTGNPQIFSNKSHGNLTIHDTLGLSHNPQAEANNLSGFPNLEATSASATQNRNEGIQENLGTTFGGNMSSFKLNCAASNSEIHPEKGLENVSSGADGTVSSWICPSD